MAGAFGSWRCMGNEDEQVDVESIDMDAIVTLARIELRPEECEKFKGHLRSTLNYVQRIMAVDVSNVLPSAHAEELYNVWDEDQVGKSLSQDDALANAPERDRGQVAIYRVVDEV
ncbi:MAG: Asp-tRNA(Asn)/Glu-tRNA(Gln) amidotransferase subunit GatC [Puniceicoccales bacterium]|nr:Asp-tRNA(Asn)/Glu-tRNA(Gln) amidotransferase subunit GatC [Puniceicoccales bacterium]